MGHCPQFAGEDLSEYGHPLNHADTLKPILAIIPLPPKTFEYAYQVTIK